MNKLTITISRDSHFFNYWKVTGFSDTELAELHKANEQGYFALKELIVKLIDKHNPGQGTAWSCGYGIYGVHFGLDDKKAIYVETGNSCD